MAGHRAGQHGALWECLASCEPQKNRSLGYVGMEVVARSLVPSVTVGTSPGGIFQGVPSHRCHCPPHHRLFRSSTRSFGPSETGQLSSAMNFQIPKIANDRRLAKGKKPQTDLAFFSFLSLSTAAIGFPSYLLLWPHFPTASVRWQFPRIPNALLDWRIRIVSNGFQTVPLTRPSQSSCQPGHIVLGLHRDRQSEA
jgi:hypothetical protein